MPHLVEVSELPPVPVSTNVTVRTFQLHLNNTTVELSSLGATITKLLLPNYNHPDRPRDDVVLSYASPKAQYEDKNSVYFGAIVGRVANRIKNGTFSLYQTDDVMTSGGHQKQLKLETYHLEINNGSNHLHGGFDGFDTGTGSRQLLMIHQCNLHLLVPTGIKDILLVLR
jgi:aldose 1-epimerase